MYYIRIIVKVKNSAENRVNLLPNDKNVAKSKLKTIADDKFIVGKMMPSAFDWVENIVG